MLARVLLAQDLPDHALPLLQRLDAAAATQGRTGSIIEIKALQALVLAASGGPGQRSGHSNDYAGAARHKSNRAY